MYQEQHSGWEQSEIY